MALFCLASILSVIALPGRASATAAGDDFNRADGALGTNWTPLTDGAMQISSNEVVGWGGGGDGTNSGELRTGETYSADQWSQIEVTSTQLTGAQWIGPTVRARTNGDVYVGIYYWHNGAPYLQIFRRVGGTWTSISGAFNCGALAAGTQLKLTVTGSSLAFYENGTQEVTGSDGYLVNGAPGIMTSGAAIGDNWAGGDDSTAVHSIGGTISGLSGAVILRDNSGDDLNLTSDGSFTFSTELAAGSAYNATVKIQPNQQRCVIANGSGTVSSTNITNLSVVCTASATSTAADNFNRADGSLGANWTDDGSGGLAISSNVAAGQGGDTGDIWNANAFSGDQYSQTEVASAPGGGDWIGPMVRMQNGGQDGYVCFYFGNNGNPDVELFSRVSGGWNKLGHHVATLSAGDQIKVSAVGSAITCQVNGVEVIAAIDNAVSGGSPGILSYGAAQVDNWSGGDATPPNSAPNTPTALAQFRSDGTTGIPATNLYNFDSSTQSWNGGGATLASDSATYRTGGGSLKVTTATGNAFIDDGNGTLYDSSANGPTLSEWVYVPSSNVGNTWRSSIAVQDSGYAYQTGSSVLLATDTWTLVTYSPPASLLQNMRAIALNLNGNATSGNVVYYVDDVQQGYATYTNQTTVVFSASVSDSDNPDADQLCVEVKQIATSFDGSTGITCSTGIAVSGSPVTASVAVPGLSNGTAYHWRVQTKDSGGLTSSWISYGGNSETTADFVIDTSAPSTGTAFDGTVAGVDAGFNDGSLSALSCNWSGFSDATAGIGSYDYSFGTTAGAVDVLGWTNVDASVTNVSASSLTLRTGQAYFCNVRANDLANNQSSVVSSNAQYVAPSLSFNVSANNETLPNLNGGNGFASSNTLNLTTSTNAYGGYAVSVYETTPMSSGSFTIPDYASPVSSPTVWFGTGFGYNVSGGSAISAFAGNKFAHVGTSAAPDTPVVHSGPIAGAPIVNEQETVTLQTAAPPSQPAGTYQTTLIWSCVPSL